MTGALAWGSVAAVTGSTRRQLPFPGHGTLSLDVPEDWRVSSLPLAKPPSLTMSVRPAAGDAFVLKMTTVWMDAAAGKSPTRDSMQESVRGAAKDALVQAEEKDAPLLDLKGKETFGYYISVTDKHSSNTGGDYKFMSQGMAATGPAMTMFTLLSRSRDPLERERVLRLVASATWSDMPPADATPDSASVRIEESPQSLLLSVTGSRLVMILPKGGLKKVPDVDRPGYFYFKDEARSLIVSGWFEPAERFPGIKKFWEGETRNASRSGLPEAQEVSFTKVGDWDTILYDLRIPEITNSHVRAHWVADGTWIDVHLSTTGTRPRAESRASLLEVLRTVRVEQKR